MEIEGSVVMKTCLPFYKPDALAEGNNLGVSTKEVNN